MKKKIETKVPLQGERKHSKLWTSWKPKYLTESSYSMLVMRQSDHCIDVLILYDEIIKE